MPKEGGDAEVSVVRDKGLQEFERFHWGLGVLAGDECINYLSYNWKRVLKLDTKTDKVTPVGEAIAQHCRAAVAGKDGNIYCIS